MAMSEHQEPGEEESGGEPSSQMGSASVSGQQLLAALLGVTTSTTYLDRVRAVLALLSLIMVFVVVLVVIALKAVSLLDLFFVVLFGILALSLNLIFAYGRKGSPRKASKPEE
jgi:predicted membrane channel-forming protein YqfA (hemolysin III family)